MTTSLTSPTPTTSREPSCSPWPILLRSFTMLPSSASETSAHESSAPYPTRSWATVVQRDLQVAAVIGDLYAGRPVGYTTFLAYDEVAHHSGVERIDALTTLRRVDRQLARIESAAAGASRPYRFVVLSDHGQSQGATFLDRYGTSLEDLVRDACETDDVEGQAAQSDEAISYLGAGLT